MLPRQVLDVLGTGLVALGVVKYVTSGYQELDAIILGVALGAGTILAGRIGGGPQPVPRGGYSFEDAMAVLRRATWGGMTIGAILTAFPFYLWIKDNSAGPTEVLLFFALSLLVTYASLVAAAGLVLVDAVVRRDAEEEREAQL